MKLKTISFSILNKNAREMSYIKEVYKRRVQSEIESYKDPEEEDSIDSIHSQHIIMLDGIYI
ncbi:Hypothetical protein P9515_15801 [Prochlorococcus marinus str. MIT 9515]|uniref:Uncharacterized protein n=1 Tax=Prochlorococcus marinus (strain MIT 9515) TaxID=167542 RepID=A2BYC6_PROM5|nr:hypothetical protein [Prochlorococcus marinus]ABM72787.1 Hypothetical protein P9515_15801 [Prochlorococcus marinus str. MIT 9515]